LLVAHVIGKRSTKFADYFPTGRTLFNGSRKFEKAESMATRREKVKTLYFQISPHWKEATDMTKHQRLHEGVSKKLWPFIGKAAIDFYRGGEGQ
jgi:hypothetical protein